MTLQILIPHYHETADVIRPLLDSIALQQNVDFSEVGVIICHDGEEPDTNKFTLDVYGFARHEINENETFDFRFGYENKTEYENDALIRRIYPFEIKQIHIPHAGVSAARNAALDHATADYVMWCDCDDMFHNACGLWILFKEMQVGFDSLVSCFIEETRNPDRKEVQYINHEMDSTFVHGKVHRRQYLLDKNIRFNYSLTIHEDSYFNILCQNLSENVKYCPTPFYLWRWRDDSVCRHDPKYILRTYRNMLDSNDALVDEFIRRERQDKAGFYCAMMVFDSYYTMNKPEWIDQENQEYRDMTEKRFSEYYVKHKSLWNSIPMQDKMQISNGVRTRSVSEGMLMESITIEEWLKRMEAIA